MNRQRDWRRHKTQLAHRRRRDLMRIFWPHLVERLTPAELASHRYRRYLDDFESVCVPRRERRFDIRTIDE